MQRLVSRILTLWYQLNYLLLRLFKRLRRVMVPREEGGPGAFSAIIFSKDRPLQLHALLQSINYHVSGLDNLIVLYQCSNAEYEKAYEKLRIKFPSVTFAQEVSFSLDLLSLLKQISTRWIFFLVDDIIFTDKLDLAELSTAIPASAIVSLRLHPKITFSYMMKVKQEPPEFTEIDKDLLKFTWKPDGIDWAYPLSVDGHIFETDEIRFLIRKINFRAPNSLEAALQIFSKNIVKSKVGICFRIPKIINFPINRIQTEFKNAAGNSNPEDLLRLFNEGGEVDFLAYRKCAFSSVHVETDLKLRST